MKKDMHKISVATMFFVGALLVFIFKEAFSVISFISSSNLTTGSPMVDVSFSNPVFMILAMLFPLIVFYQIFRRPRF